MSVVRNLIDGLIEPTRFAKFQNIKRYFLKNMQQYQLHFKVFTYLIHQNCNLIIKSIEVDPI